MLMNMIRYCRLRAGLTQEELARRTGISQPALARIEAGRVQPRIDTMRKLVAACDMSLEPQPRSGQGIDRSTIRRMLRLTPARRLELAADEARNLSAMTARRPK